MTREIDIRIGTLVGGNSDDPSTYIKQILPHGFESISITFWQTTGAVDLARSAELVMEALAGRNVTVSTLGIFGNPLEHEAIDHETLAAWEALIDNAHLFGCNIVSGFTGRVRGKSIADSMPRFAEVFGELARRAEDKGVRLAFENCAMGGNWASGDWNLAHNPKAWELMFDAVPSHALGLEWEPCHQMVQLIDPIPQIRKWANKIFHVHGKDATIRRDIIAEHGIGGPTDWCWHRTPGFGDTDWTTVISELRWAGFTGAIDIEGWHDPVYRGDLEMTGQVYGLNYLKRCRGEFVANPV